MFPIRDNVPSRSFPIINLLLISANIAAFFYELSLGRNLEKFLLWHGLVPLKYSTPGMLARIGPESYFLPFISSMFLHGGWLHIISNLWVLHIFGNNVEDRLGHLRYLFFYLFCGLAASAAQLWASWGSPLPTIGASGAIAGIMGAYLLLYPWAKVLTLIPIFIFVRAVEIPASLFLLFWILSQFYSGSLALSGARHMGGVAWWAHIGGFIGGAVLLGLFLPRRRR